MYKCQRVLSAHGFHAKLTRIYGQIADQLSLRLENRVAHLAMPQSKLFVPTRPPSSRGGGGIQRCSTLGGVVCRCATLSLQDAAHGLGELGRALPWGAVPRWEAHKAPNWTIGYQQRSGCT